MTTKTNHYTGSPSAPQSFICAYNKSVAGNLKTERSIRTENLIVVEWLNPDSDDKNVLRYADLNSALHRMRQEHSDKKVCIIHDSVKKVEQKLYEDYNVESYEIKSIANIPHRFRESLPKEDLACIELCLIRECLGPNLIHVHDDMVYPRSGRAINTRLVLPLSMSIGAVKRKCLLAWLNAGERRGVICRELTDAEVDTVFTDERILPECFSECYREDMNDEEAYQKKLKLKELIEGAKGNLYISEDDMLYGNGVDYKAIDGIKISDIKYSCAIVESERVAA